MKKTLFIVLTLLAALLVCVSCDNSLDADVFTPDPTPETDPNKMPLTLEFISDGELSIELNEGYSPCDVYYSINGGEKTAFEDLVEVSVKAGDKVTLYRDLNAKSYIPYFVIKCTSDCYVYGNVMSLVDPENYATATEVPEHAFLELFNGNAHIKNHESIDLVLPATTLAEACYFGMFNGCTGLTKAPILPATTLAVACYYSMFEGCTGLTKAPELPAEELKDFCYYHMFYGCSKLSSITCLATVSATESVGDWLTGAGTDVTATKEFHCKTGSTIWTSGGNVPTGWTIEADK